MFRNMFAATACRGRVAFVAGGPSEAQPAQIQVGTLTCSLSASIGLIVASQKNVNCIFKGRPGEPEEAYTGTMTTIGVDIGFTTGGVIVWTVFAGTNRYAGMLAGIMPGRLRKCPWPPALAPTSWSADRTVALLCSHCRYRGRSASMSPAA